MAEIDLQRFVDINIQYHEASSVASTRDTTVIIVKSGTLGTKQGPFSTLAEIVTAGYASSSDVYKYADIYFQHGGKKILILQVGNSASAAQILAQVKGLDNEYIVIASTDNTVSSALAASLAADTSVYGIKQKIVVNRATSAVTSPVKNLAIKVSDVVGAEMTIAAYLSRIDVYESNSVNDYDFTPEVVTPSTNDDELLGIVLASHNNVDMTVGETVINFGGDLTDGHDLVNQFVLIVMHQLLTAEIFNLLTKKIKGSTGIASIQSSVAKIMKNFQIDGYLSTDKQWQDDTLTVEKNGVTYTLIEKNEALNLGYKLVVLPLLSLTASEVAEHRAPAMYLFVADSYGIRKVVLNGEVI